jgi:hypothetical protein
VEGYFSEVRRHGVLRSSSGIHREFIALARVLLYLNREALVINAAIE